MVVDPTGSLVHAPLGHRGKMLISDRASSMKQMRTEISSTSVTVEYYSEDDDDDDDDDYDDNVDGNNNLILSENTISHILTLKLPPFRQLRLQL